VTGLDEFSAMGPLFTLGSFLITKEHKHFNYFFHGKSYLLSLILKTDWNTLWAIFSQTHLVTLTATMFSTLQIITDDTDFPRSNFLQASRNRD
jgi:hypothetical protein